MRLDGCSCVESKITGGKVKGLSIRRIVYPSNRISIGGVLKRQAEGPMLKSSKNEE